MSTPNMFARGRSPSRSDRPDHLALPDYREAGRWWDGCRRVLNSSSEPQSSTTYRGFVQRYRECERNAGVQWSIDFNPHPRAWHVVGDDIIYAGSEMNVDADELLKSLKSLKSLQVSPCECSAKNPDPDYPTSTRKPAPDSRRCTAGARPRPARVSPIFSAVHSIGREVGGSAKGSETGGKM
jgi:hypothetical protein